MWPVGFFIVTREDSYTTTMVPVCYLLFVLSSVVHLCELPLWWWRKTFQKKKKVHEKSAAHRRISVNIANNSMRKEDGVSQDSYDDPTQTLDMQLLLPTSNLSPIDRPIISVIVPIARIVPIIWCPKP
jgi:hypothetical protein